jgi:glucose-6-phosphate 1-dehydrogenase
MAIFGASGDLTKRMLIPSLYELYSRELLPHDFALVGYSRKELTSDSFRELMKDAIVEHCDKDYVNDECVNKFLSGVHYLVADYDSIDSYLALKNKLDEIDRERNIGGNRLLYMSVPPDAIPEIVDNLGKSGLNKFVHDETWTRIIFEKPFGHDLESAKKLNRRIQRYFREEQVYRIDHYLGKETVQNVIVTRFANGIFEPLWNRNYIDHVEITAAESIGIGERAGYYDETGALRDMVQNHLLQLLCYVAMEPPALFDAKAIRDESLKIIQSLRPYEISEVKNMVVRGQYTSSVLRGEMVPGYREERDVQNNSRTETFIALKTYIDNWRWGGVPFYIRTGKRLPTRVTEIVLHFKSTPYNLFKDMEDIAQSYNQLVIRIQPDEGILVKFAMKVPGTELKVKNVNMDFHYSDLGDVDLPNAYEKLLLDCMLGNSTLFPRNDQVIASWEFIQTILDAWSSDPSIPLHGYPAGTWGPECADDLITGKDFKWRYPCKNLTDDGLYCEL